MYVHHSGLRTAKYRSHCVGRTEQLKDEYAGECLKTNCTEASLLPSLLLTHFAGAASRAQPLYCLAPYIHLNFDEIARSSEESKIEGLMKELEIPEKEGGIERNTEACKDLLEKDPFPPRTPSPHPSVSISDSPRSPPPCPPQPHAAPSRTSDVTQSTISLK